MKITNGECFIIENVLQAAVKDLRESKVRSLTLNFFVSTNLQKTSEICQTLRKEIQEFMPERLKELNETREDISDEEKQERELLGKEYNDAINKFLAEDIEVDFFKARIPLESLEGIELNYDSTSVLALLLNNK